jgi:hypothetical protein
MIQTVLSRDITAERAEAVHRRAGAMADRGMIGAADRGMRIARAKPTMFMQALERMAETLDTLSESQYGETRRNTQTATGHRLEATVVQAWKEAYRCADENKPAISYAYYYASLAEFVGI